MNLTPQSLAFYAQVTFPPPCTSAVSASKEPQRHFVLYSEMTPQKATRNRDSVEDERKPPQVTKMSYCKAARSGDKSRR